MNRLFYTAAIATALAATACSKEENRTTADRRISISAGIEALTTRSPQLNEDGSGKFADGDTFTLHALGENGESTTLDYTIGTTSLYWSRLAFATEGTTVGFSACYPKQTPEKGVFRFDLELAGEKDLLLAPVRELAAGSEQPVRLNFRHAMHRLVVTYKAELSDDSPAIDKIETRCTAKSACTVDLASGTVTTDNDASATFTATGQKAVFLITPQHPEEVVLEVRIGEQTKRYTLTELKQDCPDLDGGKQLTVSMNIRNGEITLDGFTIDGWGDQGTIDGEIIL